jgi:hypothetical protein
MLLPRKDIVHDPAIPQWFIFMLKKHLVEAGVNPQGINIYYTEKSFFEVGSPTVAWSYTRAEGVLRSQCKEPGEIIINGKHLDMDDIYLE